MYIVHYRMPQQRCAVPAADYNNPSQSKYPIPITTRPPSSYLAARTTLTEYFLMGQQQLFSGSHIHSIPALCSSTSITTATTSSATSSALLLEVHFCNGPFLCFVIVVEVAQPVVASYKGLTSILPYFAAAVLKSDSTTTK